VAAILSAIGTSLPRHSIEQESAVEIAKGMIYGEGPPDKSLDMLYRGTCIRRRGSVLLESNNGSGVRQSFYPRPADAGDRGPATAARMQRYGQEAPRLAVEAARRALRGADTAADRITHLVTVSCTGFGAPGIEFDLIKQLDLPPTVGRVNVGFMGCHGTLNALRAAKAFADADPDAQVLLCSVELCSLHYHYGDNPQQLVANALFADGAAALVISGRPNNGSAAWEIAGCGSCLFPNADAAMTWRIGDHGFEMTLAPEVPALIADNLRPWMMGWLAGFDLDIERIGSWAIHPGGPKIVLGVADVLGLPRAATDASLGVLSAHGNMSSATVPFVLESLRGSGAPTPCVALGFGPGLVAEAALFV
jgi:predicted naringenin-chalcone synthase